MQNKTMSPSKALGIGFGVTFVVMVALLAWGLLSESSVSIPGFLDVEETKDAQGRPGSTMTFSPLGPVIAALVLSGLVWLTGRVREGAPES